MKLATRAKLQPDNPPESSPSGLHDDSLFFRCMLKASGVTRKEIQYDLRVSHTLVDLWITGEKNDPFTQARKAAAVLTGKSRSDLLPAILTYIAGGEKEFDEALMARLEKALSGRAS